jgi:hypothetical protein
LIETSSTVSRSLVSTADKRERGKREEKEGERRRQLLFTFTSEGTAGKNGLATTSRTLQASWRRRKRLSSSQGERLERRELQRKREGKGKKG